MDLHSWETTLPESDRAIAKTVRSLVEGVLSLCKWIQASLAGELQPERFLNAAKGQAVIAEESSSTLTFPVFADHAERVIALIKGVSQFDDVKAVSLELSCTPIPILCLTEEKGRWGMSRTTDETTPQTKPKNEGPFVIKVMFDIERQPWSNQQVLLAGTLYDLHAKITIPAWPDDTDCLIIDYISTLSPDQYRITKLRLDRPKDDEVKEFDCDGHAEFPVAQNLLSEPIVIRVRGVFSSSSDKQNVPAHIIGYHELRVRISDKTRTSLLSRYKSIDARLLEIVDEIRRSLPTVDSQHLNDFIEILSAITNYMGINLQQSLYREGMEVSEADFQKNLLYHLRLWLGEDVQEAPKQGGGPTDIKYKSVVVELKVEKEIGDRRKMVGKYCSQPTQYASGSGAQLGILCILDLTEKRNPPANPQSQISLETPAVHGFPDGDAPFPTKIAAIIRDGDLQLPSSYSR